MEVGEGFGLRNAGMYAVDSLRIEKGYRGGHELDTETSPWEARMGFAMDMEKVFSNFITLWRPVWLRTPDIRTSLLNHLLV